MSPTFTIVREYEGDLPCNTDVTASITCRRRSDLGSDELLDADAVTVIEWGEAVGALLPPDRLEVLFTVPPPEEDDDDTRVIELRPAGPSWEARRDDLAAVAGAGNEA